MPSSALPITPKRYYPAGEPQIFGDTEGGGTQVLYLAGVDFEKLGLPALGDEGVGVQSRERSNTASTRGFIAPVALYGILGARDLAQPPRGKEGGLR